ncbi:hypothetical protein TNCV_4300571, partial [Trichonephila clavipes]
DDTGSRVRVRRLAEDRYIVLSPKRNRRTTAQRVANQFLAASEKQISRNTVARRLRRTINTQTCCVCPIDQTAPYCLFAWCREHHNWTEQDWVRTILQMRVGSVCHRIVDAN